MPKINRMNLVDVSKTKAYFSECFFSSSWLSSFIYNVLKINRSKRKISMPDLPKIVGYKYKVTAEKTRIQIRQMITVIYVTAVKKKGHEYKIRSINNNDNSGRDYSSFNIFVVLPIYLPLTSVVSPFIRSTYLQQTFLEVTTDMNLFIRPEMYITNNFVVLSTV
jgi:hypothetical protein